MDCSPPGSSLPKQILQARILEWVACPSPGDLPNLGIEPRSPALQAYSLPSEPPGKPMNTGVGSLSLLQEIFPTQGSNPGLLHCRQILNQLSYQGSPWLSICLIKSFYYIRTDKILGDNIASVLVCFSGFSNVRGIWSNKEKKLTCKGKIEESLWAETACWSGRPSEKKGGLN